MSFDDRKWRHIPSVFVVFRLSFSDLGHGWHDIQNRAHKSLHLAGLLIKTLRVCRPINLFRISYWNLKLFSATQIRNGVNHAPIIGSILIGLGAIFIEIHRHISTWNVGTKTTKNPAFCCFHDSHNSLAWNWAIYTIKMHEIEVYGHQVRANLWGRHSGYQITVVFSVDSGPTRLLWALYNLILERDVRRRSLFRLLHPDGWS